MSDNEILNELRNIFKLVINHDADPSKINMNSKIMSDMGVNSIGLVYLVVAIEEKFNIDMSDVTYNTFTYVRDVVKYIRDRIK